MVAPVAQPDHPYSPISVATDHVISVSIATAPGPAKPLGSSWGGGEALIRPPGWCENPRPRPWKR
jgi:hypothetical protein